jgi:hypothetical protein
MDMDSAAAAARVGWHRHQIGRTALHATPATAPPGVACVRLFGAGTEEEDGGRVRRAGRLRSTRARWMAAQGRRRRQCQFMNHNEALYLPCPCAASRCMYVLLPSRVGGGLLESGQHHARVLQMAVKSPQTWLLAVLFCIGMDLILAVQVVYRVYPKGDWHSDRSNTLLNSLRLR